LPWTSFGRYEMRARGPGVIVPMDMLRDITASGVVGDATRARVETGERMLSVLIPRMVQVCKELAGKE
jgi:creatinine amidohydrolase/Fe(II)-dependent formamide hydrolase-like protein